MAETYRKLRVEDGKVILERITTTPDIDKEHILERLTIDLVDIDKQIVRLQAKRIEVQDKIDRITAITVASRP